MHLYFIKVLLLFWIPGVALTIGIWSRLTHAERRAYWITCGLMAVISFGMEYVYLWLDIWNFSEARDPLLGIRIWGAPIEEFEFWFGASPFILGLYLIFRRWLVRPARRVRHAR